MNGLSRSGTDLIARINTPTSHGMFDTLDDVRRDLGTRLLQAGKDRKAPMHSPVLVTSDVDARVMVLREFDKDAWTLRFHTDTRAPKVKVIDDDPRVAILFYDRAAKVQIRARGIGEVLREDPVTQVAWEKSDNFARRCYLGDGPGTIGDAPFSGLPAQFEGIEPSDEELIPAWQNFAVLRVTLTQLDWFFLAHTGHVRAKFSRGDNNAWDGRWVSP